MRSAAAEVVCQCLSDIIVGRMRRLLKKARRLHDHAVDAVPALHGLLIDERLLQRMQTIRRTQPLQRNNMPSTDAGQRCHAGADGAAINVHGTCAALSEPTTEARSAQPQIVSQHIEQRGISWTLAISV